jgi:hypothetical protein
VEAYSGIIENEDAGKTYQIVALIDVTEREKAQREEFARRLCDKDMLLALFLSSEMETQFQPSAAGFSGPPQGKLHEHCT